MNSNVNTRIAIGAAWMIGLRQLNRIIGLISTTILARLLLPEDFGLVVYAMTFLAIVEMFFQFGFETVLIRDQDAGPDSYNTAWTLEIIKGFSLAALLLGGAIPISLFFNEPRVEAVLYFLAAVPIMNGLKNIGVVDFQKKLEFNKEFNFNFSVRVIGVATTIALAFTLRSHWALVYGMLVNSALSMILSYFMCPYRPKLCLTEFSRVFGFSKWLLAQNIAISLNTRLPIIIIGRFFDARIVAFYNIGFELSNLVSGEFAAPLRRALFPGVASIADDEKRMVQIVLTANGIIGLVGLPATIGIAVSAPILVPLLLGGNWDEVIPVIQALAVYGAAQVLYSNSHIIFFATNRPEFTAYASFGRLAIILPGLLWLVPNHGALGAAWALSGANVIVTIAEYVLFCNLVSVRIHELISVIWRSIVGVTVMGIATFYLMHTLDSWGSQLPLFFQLLSIASVGATCYILVVLFLWIATGKPNDSAETYVMKILKGMNQKTAANKTH